MIETSHSGSLTTRTQRLAGLKPAGLEVVGVEVLNLSSESETEQQDALAPKGSHRRQDRTSWQTPKMEVRGPEIVRRGNDCWLWEQTLMSEKVEV